MTSNTPAPHDSAPSEADTTSSRPDPAKGPAHDVPQFVDLVDGIRIAMFTTREDDGTIVSRPMAVQAVDDDGTVWFFAFADSPKVDQLHDRPQVNLAFTDGNTFVSASGRAQLVDDVAKKTELWNPFAKSWFDCEPDDPAVALIRVDTTGGEYWDGPAKPVAVLGMVKSLITGGQPVDGDNAKLDLD